jgi:hypothetical protein
MAEATDSVHLAKLRARMGMAVMVLARLKAIKAAKQQLHAQGLKPQYLPLPQIAEAGEAYLAAHRAELIAEARQIIERWQAEGFFGKRAASFVQRTAKVWAKGLPRCRTKFSHSP